MAQQNFHPVSCSFGCLDHQCAEFTRYGSFPGLCVQAFAADNGGSCQDRSPLEVFDATVDQLTQHGLMVSCCKTRCNVWPKWGGNESATDWCSRPVAALTRRLSIADVSMFFNVQAQSRNQSCKQNLGEERWVPRPWKTGGVGSCQVGEVSFNDAPAAALVEGSNPCVEFSVAALLATLCAVGLKITPRFIQRCDIRGVYIGVLCAAFMPACAATSIFLWTRAAFLALAHREETRASAVLELTSLPQAREAGGNGTADTGSQGESGCALPQHAQRCRMKRCVLAMILVLMACTLLVVWIEFGKYEAFAKELDFRWGFLQSPTSGEPVPVWLGEFGTNVQNLWWKHVLKYIADNEVDFAYWSINGEKYNGIGETFGGI
eukprot:s890_g27.t1